MAFGVRNFTVSGPSNAPVFEEFSISNYTNIVYPALNANSIYIPPYIGVRTWQNNEWQQYY